MLIQYISLDEWLKLGQSVPEGQFCYIENGQSGMYYSGTFHAIHEKGPEGVYLNLTGNIVLRRSDKTFIRRK